MKRSALFSITLASLAVVIALAGLNFAVHAQTDSRINTMKSGESPRIGNNDTTQVQPQVVAYYFHTTYWCVSCRKIEAYSKEAIESGFADQLENGTLTFQSVNINEDVNKHFIKDYQLYTKSLVICNMDYGKQVEWRNLAKVWELIRDKDAFVKYVHDEINSYLKES